MNQTKFQWKKLVNTPSQQILFNQQNNPSFNDISQNNNNKNYIYNIKRNNADKYNNYNNHSYTESIATKKGKK